MLRASYSSISVDISHQHEPRPGFVVGVVIAAADDALSFTVECQVDAQTVQIVEVGSGGERVTVVHGRSWCGLTSWKPRETKRNGSVVALVLMDRTVNHVGPRVTVARSSVAKKSWHGLNC